MLKGNAGKFRYFVNYLTYVYGDLVNSGGHGRIYKTLKLMTFKLS